MQSSVNHLGDSLELPLNPGPSFCLEFPSKTSSLKTWHHFSSKEAGRLSLTASSSEVSQRKKKQNKKRRTACKPVPLISTAGPQPAQIKPGGDKAHGHRLCPPFRTGPTCLHYRQGSSRPLTPLPPPLSGPHLP